jgi:peptidoglycan hydrolase CwlO-like protein
MNRKLIVGASVGALLLCVGCNKSDHSTVKAETSVSTSKTDKGPSVDVDYSYSQKNEFVAKMKEQLADVNREIEKLSSKVASSSEDASKDAKARIERLKEKSKDLNVEIGHTESATEATWNDVKARSKKVYGDVKDSFRDAGDWVSEKIGK